MGLLRRALHYLELDHSPSLSCLGRCPCKSCQARGVSCLDLGRAFAAGLLDAWGEPCWPCTHATDSSVSPSTEPPNASAGG